MAKDDDDEEEEDFDDDHDNDDDDYFQSWKKAYNDNDDIARYSYSLS